ncbi:putative histidine kinase [Methanocella paludicola SANAE]|uniref:histidine kinase n=2 Tax=Methanocella TaxID=570266 RepID=D1YW28_METPS|nr:putative histidine kinase [Methanocella paludicola SANAE]
MLRGEEARRSRAEQMAHIGSWCMDIKLDIMACSDEFYRILGYQPGESTITVEQFKKNVHHEDIQYVDEVFNRSIREKKPYEADFRILRKDGSACDVHAITEFEYGESGDVRFIYGTVQDITGRKRTDEALKYRSELEALITTLSTRFIKLAPEELDPALNDALRKIGEFAGVDRSYIHQTTKDGKMTGITHEWCREGVGPSMEFGKQLDIMETYPWVSGFLRKLEVLHVPSVEDLPPEAEVEKRLLSASRVLSLVAVPMVCNREFIGVLGFDSVRNRKAWTEDDIAILRIVGEIFANAIVRSETERALRDSEERFRATFEQAAVGIAHVSPGGRYLRVNRRYCNIVGYSHGELLSRNFQSITHPDDLEEDLGNLASLISGRIDTASMEKRYIRKDGSIIWVTLTTTAVRGPEGIPKYVISVIEDITARKRAEAEMQEARMRAELYVDLMGHDIGNMNQAIMGYLEMAQDTVKLKDDEREFIEKPLELVKGSSALIDNVKRLQRARSGEAPVQVVDIVPLIMSLAACYSNSSGKSAGLDFNTGAVYRVVANEFIKDLFSNIIENAVKYSRSDVRIGISPVERNGKPFYRVSVEDNGPGVPDEQKAGIFSELAGREKYARRRGLGLQIVKTLVKAYGGKVWVEDRVPGDHEQGARFVVMLPALDQVAAMNAGEK